VTTLQMQVSHTSFLAAHHVQPVTRSGEGPTHEVDLIRRPQPLTVEAVKAVQVAEAIQLRRTQKSSPSNSTSGGDEFQPRLYPRVRSAQAHKHVRVATSHPTSSSTHQSSTTSPRSPTSGKRSSSRRRSTSRRRRVAALKKTSGKDTNGQTSSKATSTTRASSAASLQGGIEHGHRVYGEADSEASIMADRVRSLPDPLGIAWQAFDVEFQVQTKIWESLAMLRGGTSGQTCNVDLPTLELQRQIEIILEAATEDYIEPIEDLEDLLLMASTRDFSKAFEAAARGLLEADAVSSKRQRLVNHLEEDLAEFDRTELETLLIECEFQDYKLEYRIRQVLRLGVRSALHHNVSHGPDSPTPVKKCVRFDVGGDSYDAPKSGTSRVSDCVFVRVRPNGVASL